ncbi:hypothetical protein DPMN_076846 [Dreissena polymorpha]|uniref:G-protein coupled receptors family 1 profile domain-containing protein n=1 Tax=Dreissena polymorpha TaxID=45954 RepID=A0A9D4BG42_DREPO|nr:hypothetical protein DPMN_076846 [Dreissena polymorpha]
METTENWNNSDANITNENASEYIYYYSNRHSDYVEYDIAAAINRYYLYVICGIGIPGNVACFVTSSNMKPFRSSDLYMAALAVADLTSLLIKFSYVRITATNSRLGDVGCQWFYALGSTSVMYANWIVVALTLERFIAVTLPLKVKQLCQKRSSICVLAVLFIVVFLANIQFLFTFEEMSDVFLTWTCASKQDFRTFHTFTWYWIDGALYAFLPTLFILVFNGLIIFKIRKSTLEKRHLSAEQRHSTETSNYQRQITVMLLSVSVAFVVLTLPNCTFFIVKAYWSWMESAHGVAKYYLVMQIVFVLSDLSHALNFYLYCISGRKFRQKFLKLVQKCFHRNRTSNRISFKRDVSKIRDISGLNDVTGRTRTSSVQVSPESTPVKGRL